MEGAAPKQIDAIGRDVRCNEQGIDRDPFAILHKQEIIDGCRRKRIAPSPCLNAIGGGGHGTMASLPETGLWP
jgi:hypothetical protein